MAKDSVTMFMLSPVQLFATQWTVSHQAPQSMEFSGKNTGVDSHSPRDRPNPGIKPVSPALAGRLFII